MPDFDFSKPHKLVNGIPVLLSQDEIAAKQEDDAHGLSEIQANVWRAYQAKAQAALDFNDRVATRCTKANVPYPSEWQAYDDALRAITGASTGDPSQPLPDPPKKEDGTIQYPEGT